MLIGINIDIVGFSENDFKRKINSKSCILAYK